MAYTHALSTNNYGPAKIVVATSSANGTHTTLATAMADAVSGDTIFMRNSVSENVTLTPGVSITSFPGAQGTSQVSITGTLTMTAAGTCNVSNLRLVTNSAFVLAVTGSAASIVNLNNCFLNMTNNTGISFTTSNAAGQINLNNCFGDLGTTGIGVYASSSPGTLNIISCFITNTGSSTTANTVSAGIVDIFSSVFKNPTTSSSTATLRSFSSEFDTSAQNVTSVTIGGSGVGGHVNSFFNSGSASSVSISSTTGAIYNSTIGSSNTNALTGAGTLNFAGLTFNGTSSGNNVTTLVPLVVKGGFYQGNLTNTAPAASMIGEQITSTIASGSPVVLTSTVVANVTTISLTPGIWNVTAAVSFGGTLNTLNAASINSVSATLGTNGDNTFFGTPGPTATSDFTITVPTYRVALSATTTYYLVAKATFTGTSGAYGRISATRVA